MTSTRPKMKCPKCGAEMNHHAEKVDYSSSLKDPKAVDSAFGGIVEEFHTCTQCGVVATRRAE